MQGSRLLAQAGHIAEQRKIDVLSVNELLHQLAQVINSSYLLYAGKVLGGLALLQKRQGLFEEGLLCEGSGLIRCLGAFAQVLVCLMTLRRWYMEWPWLGAAQKRAVLSEHRCQPYTLHGQSIHTAAQASSRPLRSDKQGGWQATQLQFLLAPTRKAPVVTVARSHVQELMQETLILVCNTRPYTLCAHSSLLPVCAPAALAM